MKVIKLYLCESLQKKYKITLLKYLSYILTDQITAFV